MSRVVIIPARLGSSRLPGKPLLDLGGLPLIEHVRRRCLGVAGVRRVLVAAEDEAIVAVVRAHGGEALLTPPVDSGTDRVHAALDGASEWVVNVQGDMPLVRRPHIEALFRLLEAGAELATLAAPLTADAPRDDPAIVKVALDSDGRALDFRRVVPDDGAEWLHHVGLYGYGRSALARFVALPRGRREVSERLEQLRWLEAGGVIRVATVPTSSPGIDTPAQLQALRARYRSGELQLPPLSGEP